MHQVHPDVIGSGEPVYGFCAWEINAAYEFLMGHGLKENQKKEAEENRKGNSRKWQAPVNELAYTERDIFVDYISIAAGKYYYSEEEGFRMFLRSIYHCSRKVLEEFPDAVIQKYLGEAAYLLSQQFVDRSMVMERYETDTGPGGNIYYFPAMLETEGKRCALPAGTILSPAGVRNHRLYLNSPSRKEAGYLSFHDDLIYYALIPMFEQKRAEVKVRVSGIVLGNNNVRAVKVRALDLWVRIAACDWTQVEVKLSDQIEALMRKCRKEAEVK